MKASHIIFVFLATIILTSCVTKKKLTYLHYTNELNNTALPSSAPRSAVTPSAYKLMPYDILFIRVITPDPQWSVLFNSMPAGSAAPVTEESTQLLGYPIDRNGDIDIPFVGKVAAAGQTISELTEKLDSIFKKYVTDGAVTVRLVNNYISVIGEVRAPGRYPINRDFLNVFEALSAAGDIDLYGDRQKVQIIRPSPYGPIVKEFSLADRNILISEFYYVMPNDIIYVQPMAGKGFQNNAAIYTLFLTTITTALVIIGYFRAF
jgi:polysaccharide biosynthesis/export protein